MQMVQNYLFYPDEAPDYLFMQEDGARGVSMNRGRLGEDQMMLVQQGPGEVVDWPNCTERHGVVPPPQQVRTKHNSQVTVGHLVHLTVG